ncbi:cytochrome c3 family protein, partial [Candidatus Methylomirabilis sp.]|uniref:cytochrome c3 family protein n=1 Tax=Candidatus Methylomirabilis sp. TaxID=2032687 RepID=UPI003C786531
MRIALRIACFGLLLIAAGLIRVPFAEAQEQDACIDCHKTSQEERLSRPALKIKDDYHLARGLGCHDCHGGDNTALGNKARSHSPAKGFLGKPTRRAIPESCGKCHSNPIYMRKFNPSIRTDQVKEYYTSVHGNKLREGDQKVAVCISCHDVHAIRAVKDQMAWTYPAKVAETCSRCHGNAEYMKEYKIPTDQFEKYKQSIHYEMLTKRGDLASPTCSSC